MPKRCYGCMKIKENIPVCEHCGYNENVPNYAHQLPAGTILHGQYTVGKVLGQGGFGITYIGWDSQLEVPVAIKEYYPNSFVTRESAFSLEVRCAGEGAEELFRHNRERFLKEAKILAKLQNVPGIVRVQNLFSENNTAYIVMEYVEGIDLKHYIRMQNRVLTVQEAFSVLRPVMYALSRVHQAELVHRDISPDNIMILPDGTAKLLDFGAAREVENPDVHGELPQSTEAILKHGFAPMEQYRRRGSLGPWTDVYALCATIYYCLTGKVPNSAPERIMGDDNVNWNQIPGLTQQQMATLEKGLALMPENRLRSMEELYRGLFPQQKQTAQPRPAPKEQTRKAPDVMETNRRGESPTLPKAAKSERKKKKPTALIAAALAAVAAAGLFFLKPGEKDITVDLPEILPAATVTPEGTEPIALTPEQLAYLEAEELEKAGEYGKAAIAFGKLAGYEDARERSFSIWNKVAHRETIADGEFGVKTDGTVVSTGVSWSAIPVIHRAEGTYDPEEAQWNDIVALSGYYCNTVGLMRDGTVVTTIENIDISGWRDIVAIDNSMGLKIDGTVMYADDDSNLAAIVSRWTDIVAVCSGNICVGLRSDGTVIAYSSKWNNEQGDYDWTPLDLSKWTDITAIDSAGDFIIGLRSDGTVVVTDDSFDVSGWTDIVAIAAESYITWQSPERHIVGLRADGTVIATGSNRFQQCDVSNWKDIAAIGTGTMSTIGLHSDGTVVAVGYNVHGECRDVSKWTNILLPSQSSVGVSVESKLALSGHVLSPDWKEIIVSTPGYKPFESIAQIESITFLDTLENAPAQTWDVSEDGDGSVLAWAEGSNLGSLPQFHVYIAAEGGVCAPVNSRYLFGARPYGMTNLRNIFFSGAFYTGNVTSMEGMFCHASSLSQLDLSCFDTSRVANMEDMFFGCRNLTALDLRSFDTSLVTNMDEMFYNCRKLTDLKLQEFNTDKVASCKNFMDDGMTVNSQPWEELFERG